MWNNPMVIYFDVTISHFMAANLPSSSVDLLLYKEYPSFPVTVLDTNTRGYRLEYFPSIMHGEFGFSSPHRNRVSQRILHHRCRLNLS
ncbi:unnamed protein product [Onchocerca ochengi]|uniref:Transposase n=1 Tax=Onchocerca ochengi TaxID=42157 RepID=A0A182EID4_ONCOC|nr:unnamed protein product [Onchocerca ochengi]